MMASPRSNASDLPMLVRVGWQLPDRIELIDAVPRTSVGKFDKKALRARFAVA